VINGRAKKLWLAIYGEGAFLCLDMPPRLAMIILHLLGNAPKAVLILLLLVMDPELHNSLRFDALSKIHSDQRK
jgi:hypothetical protein